MLTTAILENKKKTGKILLLIVINSDYASSFLVLFPLILEQGRADSVYRNKCV